MPKNAYIHIPFCKRKCHYCSFISYNSLEQKDEYLAALSREIVTEYKGEKLNTLYFGGGTPSLLSTNNFKELLSLFNFENNAEITIEANPESINFEYLRDLKELGINRLSIGAQTFDDKILEQIGRMHNSLHIKEAVKVAKNAGFKNISLDLIYGLPNQTLQGFENDLKTALSLDVEHISLYGLKIEERSYFSKNMPNSLPDLDLQADMYLQAIALIKNAGFEHYEISNFSLPGYNSRHNLNYWENNTYYGFGCAASGYINKIRYTNQLELNKYIENPIEKFTENKLSEQEILEEAIFLGFRKIAGINIEEINKKFGINFENKYAKTLKKYENFFIKTQYGYRLSIDGILVSNEILSEFIELNQ